MKTLRLKLISLIAMVCLVLGLVVVGIYAAEIQYIKLGGNITFNVDDKSLYVQDVRIQEDMQSNPYSLKQQGDFIPGYINGEFNMNLGTYNNTYGGLMVYFDIINTMDENRNSYMYDVTASTTQTDGEIEVQAVVDNAEGYIPFGSITPSEITSTTQPTATVILTITSSQGVEVDLSQITITFTDPVYYDFTFTTDDQTGTATLDSYTGNSAEVIIPNTISVMTINDQTLYLQGNQYEVTAIRDGSPDKDGVFYNNRSNLTSVTLPDNLQTIGVFAFYYCSSLTNVTFPETLQTIGAYAFYYCTGLTSITLPESITSIGNYAFRDCRYLTEINYNIPSLSNLGSNNFVFCNAGHYGTGITVNFGDNVESVPANLFCPQDNGSTYSPNITEVNFSSSITSIGFWAFAYCTSLTTIDLSSCTNMDTIGSAVFYNCTNLNSVVINEYVFSNVTSSSSSCGYILAYLQSGEGTVYVPEAVIEKLGHTNEYLNSSFTLQSDTAVGGYYVYVKN